MVVIKTLENNEELALAGAGYACIVGMDEAGMGPLAGPVVVGGACLPEDYDLPYLNDSKKLSEKRRENLYLEIQIQTKYWAVGVASAEEVNKLGIRPATFLAYSRVLESIPQADYLLVDAWTLPGTNIHQKGIVKGDTKIASIAAASILAKVHRDRMMTTLHQTYPVYGFDRHKGYGTKAHMQAIKEHGPCAEHRTSWSIFDRL